MSLLSPLKERKKVYLIVLLSLIASTALGSAWSIGEAEAEETVRQFKSMLPERISPLFIFSNNFRASLLMLIPFIGLPLGYYITFSTGRVLAAFGFERHISGLLLFGFTAIMPFFWLEFLAYGLTSTECVYLTLGLLKRRVKEELKPLLLTIGISFVLLFAGAWVEFIMVEYLT